VIAEADLHDDRFMALVPVIEEAGGIITGRWGSGRVIAAGDARVHAQALELLALRDH
jgi:hypothetical protein